MQKHFKKFDAFRNCHYYFSVTSIGDMLISLNIRKSCDISWSNLQLR